MRRPMQVAMVAGACAAASAATAVAQQQPDAAAPGTPQFSVTSRPLTAEDALADSLVSALRSSGGSMRSVDWSQARRATDEVWLVASGGNLCIHQGTPAAGPTACGPIGAAGDGRTYLTFAAAGRFTIGGALPDGVDAVRLTTADGTARSLPVTANAYSATTASPPRQISFAGSDGTRAVQVISSFKRTRSGHRRHRRRG
jgi:hypothetical protein